MAIIIVSIIFGAFVYFLVRPSLETPKGHKPINLGGPSVFIWPDQYGDIPVTGLKDEQTEYQSTRRR